LEACLPLLALLCWTVTAWADGSSASGLKPDVRLLIDISGSMRESDPDNLRAPALDLIVRLLPEGSRAGVWIFGEEVELLVPHRVIDAEWRRAAQEAVVAIDNSGLRTNIPAALAAATYDLQRMDPAYRSSIVLLTDGKVDVSESPMANISAARTVLARTALELGATGIPVHTIALSEDADWSFLQSLAEQTSGIAEKAQSAGELTAIFLQSLEIVAPSARVPVAGSRFQIDSSVEEFTALIFVDTARARIGLVSPSNTQYLSDSSVEDVLWFRNQQFALVTVTAPEAGSWQLLAPDGATTRVTVISDLQLEVDPLPNKLPAGRHAELGLRLRERGEVLLDPEVLDLFSISIEVQGDTTEPVLIDVSSQYPVPDDGEFRITVPPFALPGRYRVMVRVNTQTLQRELPMYVDVAAVTADPAIVTRGDELPQDDLKKPLVKAGIMLLVAALALLVVLRRRKRRQLELWRRRSRSGAAVGDGEALVQGLRAGSADQNEP